MATPHPSSLMLSPRRNAHNLLKLPNFDDIDDLAEQVHKITDFLSSLLSDKAKWRKSRSSERYRVVLDGSVDRFCTFCQETVALLRSCYIISRRVVALLASISDPECHSSTERFASDLRSQMASITTGICSAEQHYKGFTSQVDDLLRIAPDHQHQLRDSDLDKTFERLDAFWKVVTTQLSSVLEGRNDPPSPDVTHDARNKWQEYEGCLLGAIDALTQSSDALRVSANGSRVRKRSLSGYVMRGFIAFWSRLARRRQALKVPTKSKDHVNEPVLAKFASRVVTAGALRRLTISVREQPVNFMIIVHQSLMTATNGQSQCRAGSKAVKVLLGEENGADAERDKAKFVTTTLEEMKNSASDLNGHTNGIQEKFRILRTVVLDLHEDLNKSIHQGQRPALFGRLSRHFGRDVRTCEDVLFKVQEDLGEIDNSLNLINSWWQRIQSDTKYLQINGGSSLALLRNRITLKEIGDSYATLEKEFADYLDKMSSLYDENIVNLNDSNRKYVMKVQNCANLVVSANGRLEPSRG